MQGVSGKKTACPNSMARGPMQLHRPKVGRGCRCVIPGSKRLNNKQPWLKIMLHRQPCDLLVLVLSWFAFSARVLVFQLFTFYRCLRIQGLTMPSVTWNWFLGKNLRTDSLLVSRVWVVTCNLVYYGSALWCHNGTFLRGMALQLACLVSRSVWQGTMTCGEVYMERLMV